MKISVITKDKYLKAQAELLSPDSATISFYPDSDADITLLDIDTVEADGNLGGRVIRLSRTEGKGDKSLPLPLDFYRSFKVGEHARLSVNSAGRSCSVDGNEIKLTGHEYALLSLLASKNGEYATREEISELVFSGSGDNMINLYVHYLREKLEVGAEKIILSSRKLGYAINADFLGGKIC